MQEIGTLEIVWITAIVVSLVGLVLLIIDACSVEQRYPDKFLKTAYLVWALSFATQVICMAITLLL